MRGIRTAIVGCGRIAQSSHLPAIKEVKALELVATCDVNLSQAEEVAKAWGAEWATDKLEAVCNAGEIDALILCLPHHLHKEAVVKAAKSGKDIFVEKPLGRFVAECDEMISAAERFGVILMVGHVMRFSSKFRRVKAIIESGNIGIPCAVRGRRLTYQEKPAADWWKSKEQCGGLVIPLIGSHIFDTIFWLMNASPKKVFAMGKTARNIWEGEDEADVMMVLDNGVISLVSLSFNSHMSINDLIIVGNKNSLSVIEEDLVVGEPEEESIEKFVLQMREFAEAILENRSPAVDGLQARKVVAVMEAAKRSMETGRVAEL